MSDHRRKHDRHQPRSWFGLFLRVGGWAALLLGGILVVLTLISASQLYIADQLDRDGTFARAVIMQKRVVETTDSDGDTSYSFYATFRFKTSSGGAEVERGVGGGFYDSVNVKDEVEIRYLKSDPTTLEYETGQYRRSGTILRWVGLIIGLAGLGALWRFGSQTNAAILARRDGEKRFAEVTGIRDTSVEINDRRQARLLWREDDGRTGESFMHDRAKLSRLYGAGDKIVVFRLGDEVYWEGDVGPPRRDIKG